MQEYFTTLQKLVYDTKVVIDRPKESAHPKYPDYIYELDYGYLEGTSSADGGGIDVWLGSGNQQELTGVLVIVDPVKKDSEIKVLLGCNDDEQKLALAMSNKGEMKAMLIKNGDIR